MHRYLWAAPLVAGRDVLDLTSGEGFGSAILTQSADSVTGIDIDRQDLSAFADGTFGAVVAFELIGHLGQEWRTLAEASRVLSPDGLLIVSLPVLRVYASSDAPADPAHARELDLRVFEAMLARHFPYVRVWGQRAITGSILSAADDNPAPPAAPSSSFFLERAGDGWVLADDAPALHLVALASRSELPVVASESTLADCDQALLRAAEAQAGESIRVIRESLEARERAAVAQVDSGVAERAALAAAISDRDVERTTDLQRIAELTSAREHDYGELQRLSGEVARLHQAAEQLRQELAAHATTSAQLTNSLTWRVSAAARERLFGMLGGGASPAVRITRTLVHGAARQRSREPAPAPAATSAPLPAAAPSPAPPIVRLPEFPEPTVSLVIPVRSAPGLTLACLRSIAEHTSGIGYEVIVVDDDADPETKAALAEVVGARIIVNETSLGYLRSVNRGAVAARGEWLVLCTNDVEMCDGWLDALLDCGRSDPEIAVVTPKYLSPGGLVSEAGGIVWRDGTRTNYGRGHRSDIFHFRFRREVDYGSAATLLVRSPFWREIGGYDERFAPMSYEDVDLCFQARRRGMKVMYEPLASIVHHEGGTAGTDVNAGHQRFQGIHRTRFVEKWRSELTSGQRLPGEASLREAANRSAGPHILIIDYRIPRWDRDAGSLRMKTMIESLLGMGCRVTFLPDDLVCLEPYARELERLGVEVWSGELNVDAELGLIGPGLAMVLSCRPTTTSHWLDLVRERAPSVPVLYDTVDLHWLRELRRSASGEAPDVGREDLAHGTRAQALHELEVAMVRATDGTLVVSEAEAERVRADVPDSTVWVAPNVHRTADRVPPREDREGLVFVGGFAHPPNVDAVLRLVRDVMPNVWARLPGVPVRIVGGDPPPEVLALSSPLVEIVGWVPEVEPELDRAAAMVAPLTFGAGLKGKITQALAAGVPVVTTTVGAEGVHAQDGVQLLVHDSNAGIAERVVRILTEPSLWRSMSASGQELARERFSPEVMMRVLDDVVATLPALRVALAGGGNHAR